MIQKRAEYLRRTISITKEGVVWKHSRRTVENLLIAWDLSFERVRARPVPWPVGLPAISSATSTCRGLPDVDDNAILPVPWERHTKSDEETRDEVGAASGGPIDDVLYRKTAATLNFLAQNRPDLCFVSHALARKMSCPDA